jgi:hypothetical protein
MATRAATSTRSPYGYNRPADDGGGFPPFTDADYRAAGMEPPELRETAPAGFSRRQMRQADEEQSAPYRQQDADVIPIEAGRRRRSSTSSAPGARRYATGVRQGATAGLGLVQGKAPASLAAGVLGVLTYAVAINYLQGGWPQVKGWFGAKFANTPYKAAASTSSATTLDVATKPATTSTSSTVVAPGQVA